MVTESSSSPVSRPPLTDAIREIYEPNKVWVPRPFRSQLKQMQQCKDEAKTSQQAERWQEKIDDFVKTTNEAQLTKKELNRLTLGHIGKKMSKLRWIVNWVFKGVIHPATFVNTKETLRKALDSKNAPIRNYLDSPLFAIDFAQIKDDKRFVTAESVNFSNEFISGTRQAVTANYVLKKQVDNLERMNRMIRESDPYFHTIQTKVQAVYKKLTKDQSKADIPLDVFTEALQQEFELSFTEDAGRDLVNAEREFDELVKSGQAERLYFYTSNYDQIDGAVIYPKGMEEKKGEPWKNPTLVFLGGNMSFMEGQAELAQKIANEYSVNVVLYNAPGVMYSMGKERGEKDAINAFKGVYNKITERVGGDQQRIAVLGHSLGGGISTVSLGALAKEGVITPKQQPGLFINYHSFSSFSRVVANAHSLSNWVTRQIIKTLGFGNMNAAKTLQDHSVAKKVVIVSSEQDAIIKGYGQLMQEIGRLEKKKKVVQGNITPVVTKKIEGEGIDERDAGMRAHNDMDALLEPKTEAENAIPEAIKSWTAEVRTVS